ncbi:hypothetical protein GCM10009743_24090 [Kribbella swartbergensis]
MLSTTFEVLLPSTTAFDVTAVGRDSVTAVPPSYGVPVTPDLVVPGLGVGCFSDPGLEAVAYLFRRVRAAFPLAPRDHHARCGHADEPRKSYDLPYLHGD